MEGEHSDRTNTTGPILLKAESSPCIVLVRLPYLPVLCSVMRVNYGNRTNTEARRRRSIPEIVSYQTRSANSWAGLGWLVFYYKVKGISSSRFLRVFFWFGGFDCLYLHFLCQLLIVSILYTRCSP